jgi:hypothetical protein
MTKKRNRKRSQLSQGDFFALVALQREPCVNNIVYIQVNFQWDDDEFRFVLDQHAELDIYIAAHWNNSPRVDMSLHSDTIILIPSQPVCALSS